MDCSRLVSHIKQSLIQCFVDLLSWTSSSPPVSSSPHPSQLLPHLLFCQNTLSKVVFHVLWGHLNHLPSLWVFQPKEKIVIFIRREEVLRLIPIAFAWRVVTLK